MAFVESVLRGKGAGKLWLLVETHEEMNDQGDDGQIDQHMPAPEEEGFAADRGQHTYIHWIADKAVESTDDEMFGRQGGHERSVPDDDEANDGLEEGYEPRGDECDGGEHLACWLIPGDAEASKEPRHEDEDNRGSATDDEKGGDGDIA